MSISKRFNLLTPSENKLVMNALQCLENLFCSSSYVFKNSQEVSSYLKLQLGSEKNEVFAAIFMDNSNRFLAFEKLFYGTTTEAKIYPRVVAQKALAYNAVKVIFAHNHISGNYLPSEDDEAITKTLQFALDVFDIKVIDHFIVAGNNIYSFVDHGLI